MEDYFEYDVFLSFSNKDIDFARSTWKEMQMQGLKVFLSDETLKSNIGRSFFNKVESALARSKNFVLICSPNSMKSQWVQTEYETFFNECFVKSSQERRLIILKGNNFDFSLVPIFLKRLQIANSVEDVIDTLKIKSESETKIEAEGRQKEDKEDKEDKELVHGIELDENKGKLASKEKSEKIRGLTSIPSINEISQAEHSIDILLKEIETETKKRKTHWIFGGLMVLIAVIILIGVFNIPKWERVNNTKENKQQNEQKYGVDGIKSENLQEDKGISLPKKDARKQKYPSVTTKPEDVIKGVEGGVEGEVKPEDIPPKAQKANIDIAIQIPSISIPKRIKYVEPIYPSAALKAHIQGIVVAQVTIDIYGRVVDARVVNGHPLLREATLKAVSSWLFEPYILNGEPKPAIFTVVARFNLNTGEADS